jgi:hypothetical protein
MVKRTILTVLQFAAFLGLMFVGGDWDIINLQSEMRQMAAGNFHPHVLIPTIKFPLGTHILIANGILYATILLVLILFFEILRKKLNPWAAFTLLAFLLAVIVGFAAKMGLPPAPTPESSSIQQLTVPSV